MLCWRRRVWLHEFPPEATQISLDSRLLCSHHCCTGPICSSTSDLLQQDTLFRFCGKDQAMRSRKLQLVNLSGWISVEIKQYAGRLTGLIDQTDRL